MKKVTVFFFILFSCSLLFSQVNQQWAQRFNGPANAGDQATDIAVDNSGNVYVTGYSYGNGTGYDYSTVKYNSAGVFQWERRYNGAENGDDQAYSIALNSSGDLIVTGYEYIGNFDYNFVTIKYDHDGIQQWIRYFKGPVVWAYTYPISASIVIDPQGNALICGARGFNYSPCGNDFAVLKYNADGELQWAQYRDGNGCLEDCAVSIVLDATGNIFATGHFSSTYTWAEFATIKYNENGAEQWVRTYGVIPPHGMPTDELAKSIAVDQAGNVYITGVNIYDFMKLNYVTIKYNPSGIEQWVQIKDSVGTAYSIAVDSSGNSYVTGDGGTIKYNTNGVEQWMQTHPGNTITLDASGNVYIAGTSGSDYSVIKYDSNGVEQWTRTYNGPGNGTDLVSTIATDPSGAVYVTGSSTGSGTGFDFATIKYEQYPLPVELTYFNSVVNKNDVTLKWSTESEINNKGFEVMRSSGKDEWKIMGFINGSGTTSEPMNYTFTDNRLAAGKYDYRLKQIDYNGNFELYYLQNSVIVGIPDKLELSQNYPNPSNPKCRINYSIPVDGMVSIKVYDVLGRLVAVLANEFKKADYYTIEFDGTHLASGVYFYRIKSGEFTVSKKMVLLK